MRFLALIVMLCLGNTLFGQAVWNGYVYNAPVCNKPNCAMCNAIRAQLAAASTPTPTVQPTQQYTTQYETRAVTKQVKRCNGRTCWYENLTEYVQVPVSVPVATKPDYVDTPYGKYSTDNPIPPYTHRDDSGRLWQAPIKPKPVKNDISLDLVPTPEDAIPILVSLLRPSPDDIFMEPGCGDGRVLAAISHICPAIGIELNKETASIAKDRLDKHATIYRLPSKPIVLVGDATQADYTRATIVSMYLYPDVMEKIVPLLQPGTRIVSYCHTIPGIKCQEYTSKGHTFYVGVK